MVKTAYGRPKSIYLQPGRKLNLKVKVRRLCSRLRVWPANVKLNIKVEVTKVKGLVMVFAKG